MKTKSTAVRSKRAAMLAATVVASSLALSACGGGGDDQPPATSSVPAEVSQSSLSFSTYISQLVGATANSNTDDLSPVDLSATTNPPEDNDSPTPAI